MTDQPQEAAPLTAEEERQLRREFGFAPDSAAARIFATLDAARTPSQPEHHPDGACWAAVAYCTNDAGHPGSHFNPRVSPDPDMPPPEYPAWIVEDPSDG